MAASINVVDDDGGGVAAWKENVAPRLDAESAENLLREISSGIRRMLIHQERRRLGDEKVVQLKDAHTKAKMNLRMLLIIGSLKVGSRLVVTRSSCRKVGAQAN
jgi:hypothetical protein